MMKKQIERNKWIRRAIALFIGISVLAIFEGATRLSGLAPERGIDKNRLPLGMPLFDKEENEDGEIWRTSEYFIKEIEPVRFKIPRPPDVFRIVCVGASTTLGFPMGPPTAYPRWLETMLDATTPAADYEVLNLGCAGFSIHAILLYADEIIASDPDMVIVYSGHNEFLTGAEQKSMSPLKLKFISGTRALENVALYRFISAHFSKGAVDRMPEEQIYYARKRLAGKRPERPVPFWPEEKREEIRQAYKDGLDKLITLFEKEDIPVLLCTLVSNQKDYAPQGSVLPSTVGKEWESRFEQGYEELMAEEFGGALVEFGKAYGTYGEHALLNYYRGRALLFSGRPSEAEAFFVKAIDLDDQPMRSPSWINEILNGKIDGKKVFLADVEAAFREASASGIPGSGFILDNVHPRIRGHRLIAETLLDAISKTGRLQLPDQWKSRADLAAKEAWKSIPSDVRSRQFYSLVPYYLRLGRPRGAKSMCESALKENPANRKAAESLSALNDKFEGTNTYE